MSIYVDFKSSITDKSSSRLLPEIIDDIKEEKYSTIVNYIQQSRDGNERNLKLKLPVFKPALNDNTVSGLVQFDVDLKDNEYLHVSGLRQSLMSLPETAFIFTSPRGGLKFAIATDFSSDGDIDFDITRKRYKKCYDYCKNYINNLILTEIKFDDCVKRIDQECFLSCDKNAFYQEPSLLKVNKFCFFDETGHDKIENKFFCENSIEQVSDLLSYIPKDLRYDERIPVNYAVFGSIGDAGINLLFNHWTTEDRPKLLKDLTGQSRKQTESTIGKLVSLAKAYGYKPVASRNINKESAKDSNYKFPDLLTINEAGKKIDNVISDFLSSNKKNVYLNVSAGFGKTEAIIKILRKLDHDKKVLFLVKSHELGTEIEARFREIEVEGKGLYIHSQINHIYGKTVRCDNPVKERYKKASVVMPNEQCFFDCPNIDSCHYITQFDKITANIRIMTHSEFMNDSSLWFHGSCIKDNLTKPRSYEWKPDFIVIDEDWIIIEHIKEEYGSAPDSIKNIIHDMKKGLDLKQAVIGNAKGIRYDCKKFDGIKFKNIDQYIKEKASKKDYKLLKVLNEYLITNDDTLDHIIFRNSSLEYIRVKGIDKRFDGIKKIFLDATANSNITSSLIDNLEFVDVKVKMHESNNIYMLENGNYTKTKLKNLVERKNLIDYIKNLIHENGYNSVGLITYQNLANEQGFWQTFKEEIGASVAGYFGNIRGTDQFTGCDCLLVVGRYMLPMDVISDYMTGLYGYTNVEQETVECNIRMKDGSVKSIQNRIFTDKNAQSVMNHFSKAETVQAIGRARLIWNERRDVYLFSKESLGSDIEIKDFFQIGKVERVRKNAVSFDNMIMNIKNAGYCEDTPKALLSMGFKEYMVKKNRNLIDENLLKAGIKKTDLKVIKNYKKLNKSIYYCSDNDVQKYLLDNELKPSV